MPRFSNWIKNTVLRRELDDLEQTDLVALVTDSPVGAAVTVADLSAYARANSVQGDGITDIVAITAADYGDLSPPDPSTLYVIIG